MTVGVVVQWMTLIVYQHGDPLALHGVSLEEEWEVDWGTEAYRYSEGDLYYL